MAENTRSGTNPRQVLIIEDEGPAIRLFELAFEESDATFDVEVATAGQEALDRLFGDDDGLPDVVVLDLDLPGVNGLDVLKRIRTDAGTEDLPVVVVSHHDDREIIAECRRLGVTDYFIKPDDYEGMLTVAKQVGEMVLQTDA